ncbi:MAG: ergothioneine biosynthesis protein EgtB [Pseudomonadota bacterium]
MPDYQSPEVSPKALWHAFERIRRQSELLCSPLAVDDYQIQSITETSPPKWHLGHVTWFFEAFILSPLVKGYRPYNPDFFYLFNSYYETVGTMQPRPLRGMLARPTVEEVYRYRRYVDEQMEALFHSRRDDDWETIRFRTALGLNHEQQHQELLLMDIKHNFSINPLKPAYAEGPAPLGASGVDALTWESRSGGIQEIGQAGGTFAYDNEGPRHQALLREHRLARRLITNGEYLAFIEEGGYRQVALWLSDGWSMIKREGWESPLYWRQVDGQWYEFTLWGERALDLNAPVCHISYYEADAFARWAGKRLPDEAELEVKLQTLALEGNFVESGRLHPSSGGEQWYGDLWEWSRSPYGPYPGFQPLEGSMGEYNGKFMCNQFVLRGGCCATPIDHMRPSYRNFFYPHDRWAFSGIRLAEDE